MIFITSTCRELQKEPTIQLIRRIFKDSDRLALEVFLETRRLFQIRDNPPLLLSEFLSKLRDRIAPPDKHDANDYDLAYCAYDLTLAKYSNIPTPTTVESTPDKYAIKGSNTDCRHYYRAFLKKFEEQKKQETIESEVQKEMKAGKLLQALVWKNFLRSKLDCKRDTPFSIRYTWEKDGKNIYVWYPSYMTSKEFKFWLEETIFDINLNNLKKEQRRIQAIIDKRLGKVRQISEEVSEFENILYAKEESSSIEFKEGRIFTQNLSKFVAKEKAENLVRLRPGIKKLGKTVVMRMILDIFRAIEHDKYEVTQIANKYGVSKATLSRFAGSTWFEKIENNESVVVPDLWKNTAQVLAGNPVFMEMILTSSIVDRFEEILKLIKNNGGKKNA